MFRASGRPECYIPTLFRPLRSDQVTEPRQTKLILNLSAAGEDETHLFSRFPVRYERALIGSEHGCRHCTNRKLMQQTHS